MISEAQREKMRASHIRRRLVNALATLVDFEREIKAATPVAPGNPHFIICESLRALIASLTKTQSS